MKLFISSVPNELEVNAIAHRDYTGHIRRYLY